VRDHLQSELGLTERVISVQEDGQPPPSAGDVYYTVHPMAWLPQTGDPADVLDELYEIGVTVTQRTPQFPRDRRMENAYLKALVGLEKRCRAVMLALHLNYDVIASANILMEGESLCELLRWRGTDARPTVVDGTWFFAAEDAASGQYMEVRFGGARRIQRVIKAGDPDVLE